MFKWFKKWYLRYKLKNKRFLIQSPSPFSIQFYYYYPSKSIVKLAFRSTFDDTHLSKLNIVLRHSSKEVFIEKVYKSYTFNKVNDEHISKEFFNAHNEYLTELQEIEFL